MPIKGFLHWEESGGGSYKKTSKLRVLFPRNLPAPRSWNEPKKLSDPQLLPPITHETWHWSLNAEAKIKRDRRDRQRQRHKKSEIQLQ